MLFDQPGLALLDEARDDRQTEPRARGHGREKRIEQARVVAPGDPERSVLLRRVTQRGPGQMPQLATSVVDAAAVAMLKEWIRSLKPSEPGASSMDSQTRDFGKASARYPDDTRPNGSDRPQSGARTHL